MQRRRAAAGEKGAKEDALASPRPNNVLASPRKQLPPTATSSASSPPTLPPASPKQPPSHAASNPAPVQPSDGARTKRNAGSRTHRRTLARQINFKEVEEGEGARRKQQNEEEKERDEKKERERAAAQERAAPVFTQQVRPISQHGQWKPQHSVLVPDDDSSSDESEDDAQVAERERRRAEQDREKEKEMRLHGLLPTQRKKSTIASNLPAVSLSKREADATSEESKEGKGAVEDADYSGFHKKALKWQKRSKKEKEVKGKAEATPAKEEASKAEEQKTEEKKDESKDKKASKTARVAKIVTDDDDEEAAAKPRKPKKTTATAAAEGRQKRMAAWKSQAAERGNMVVTATPLTTAAAVSPQPTTKEQPNDQPDPARSRAESIQATISRRESAVAEPKQKRSSVVVAEAKQVPVVDLTKLPLSSDGKDRVQFVELTPRMQSPLMSARTHKDSLTSSSKTPLGDRALALLSSSLTSTLTSSLTGKILSGASLIAQADKLQKAQSASSTSTSPLLPSSPHHLPRLSPQPSQSRPGSRKHQRRIVEAALTLEQQDDDEPLDVLSAVLPVPSTMHLSASHGGLMSSSSAIVASFTSSQQLSVTQPILVETFDADGGELVMEETVLSLKTIEKRLTHAAPLTATVLANYLHDLSHASSASPPSLPPPPLSVHELVDSSGASDDDPTSPSVAYEPSAEAILSYAECLGMDLPYDSDLLWIPRLALLQPLPPPWRACTADGNIYFVQWETGECSFTDPSDEHYWAMYRQEKERKWVDLIEREMEESGVRRDGRLDMSGKRLDDIGMEVLSDMILGMGEMEDEKDEKRRERRRMRRRKRRRKQPLPTDAPQSEQEDAEAHDDDDEEEEEEPTIPGYNIGILLTSLDLSNNRIGSTGCDTLLSSLALSLHAPLATLNLSSNLLSSDSCITLSRYLSSNPYLLHLDVSNNENIGNMGAEHLARSLTTASSLRWLGLSKCGLSDFGCLYLCSGLLCHPTLAALDLSENEVGERGLKELGRLLMSCPTLWDVRANGLRESTSTTLRSYIDDEAGQPQSATGSGGGEGLELVKEEVLLCLEANRESVLSKRRMQAALLAGLTDKAGEQSALRRVFAVEAWAEREEEEEDKATLSASNTTRSTTTASTASRGSVVGEDGRKKKAVSGSAAGKKDGKEAAGKEGGRRVAGTKKERGVSRVAGKEKKSGEKRKGKEKKSKAAGGGSGDDAPAAGVQLVSGGASVRIGSVGIARQQGLADNALRQVWSYL